MDPFIAYTTRSERRKLLSNEKKNRSSGYWGSWETVNLPNGVPCGSGWASDVRLVSKNNVFAVLIRPLGGKLFHLAITSLSGRRPTWHEMQRIKNDLCGESAIGIEIYPSQDSVVDEADVFHLWVGAKLPVEFSI